MGYRFDSFKFLIAAASALSLTFVMFLGALVVSFIDEELPFQRNFSSRDWFGDNWISLNFYRTVVVVCSPVYEIAYLISGEGF
jgi:anti-sigma-K factor RskA